MNNVVEQNLQELGPLAPPSTPNLETTLNGIEEATLDSGSTGLFLGYDTKGIVDIQPTSNPLEVLQPDKSVITSTHTGRLDLPQLPKEATLGHMFPSLKGTALVPVGPLCDAGCTVHFYRNIALVKYKGKVIWSGKRNPNSKNRLYMMPLTKNSSEHHANAITMPTKACDMVRFSHATFWSPTLHQLTTALKKHYVEDFPALTLSNLKKYPPDLTATQKGHMDQQRANINSTNKEPVTEEEMLFPKPLDNGQQTHACFVALCDPQDAAKAGLICGDQTGKLPQTSRSGNKIYFHVQLL